MVWGKETYKYVSKVIEAKKAEAKASLIFNEEVSEEEMVADVTDKVTVPPSEACSYKVSVNRKEAGEKATVLQVKTAGKKSGEVFAEDTTCSCEDDNDDHSQVAGRKRKSSKAWNGKCSDFWIFLKQSKPSIKEAIKGIKLVLSCHSSLSCD